MNCCPHARPLKLRKGDLEKTILISCQDWRNCSYCRAKRHGNIRRKLWQLLSTLDTMDTSNYYPLLLTFTIAPRRYKAYGIYARGLLCEQINLAGIEIRKQLAFKPLIRVRAYEFCRDGKYHCHLLLLVNKADRLNHSAIRQAYKVGTIDFHYGYYNKRKQTQRHFGELNVKSSIRYILKYVLQTEEDERTRKFHTPGTRYYHVSYSPKFASNMFSLHRRERRRTTGWKLVEIGKKQLRRELWNTLLQQSGLPQLALEDWPLDTPQPYLLTSKARKQTELRC